LGLVIHEKLQRPNLPIFVITALPLTSVGEPIVLLRIFFQKPLDLDVMVAAIRNRLSNSGHCSRNDNAERPLSRLATFNPLDQRGAQPRLGQS